MIFPTLGQTFPNNIRCAIILPKYISSKMINYLSQMGVFTTGENGCYFSIFGVLKCAWSYSNTLKQYLHLHGPPTLRVFFMTLIA